MPQSQRGSQRKESSGEKNGSQQEEEARLQVGFQTVNLQIVARSLDKPAPDNKGNTTLGTKRNQYNCGSKLHEFYLGVAGKLVTQCSCVVQSVNKFINLHPSGRRERF